MGVIGQPRPDLSERNRQRANPAAPSRHPFIRLWRNLVARCTDPASKDWHRYGGRGILVCERWRGDFWAFVADMGPRPTAQHQVDRINNNGNYEPGNCRWATSSENNRNRRSNRAITWRGETRLLVEWAQITGISRVLLAYRLKSGWTVEEAFTRPADRSVNFRHATRRTA